MINIREKIRARIMQEALDLADRNDSEGYNAVKVMCTDVLGLLETPQRTWVGLTPSEIDEIIEGAIDPMDALLQTMDKLKEKNT